jgi:predicted ATPase
MAINYRWNSRKSGGEQKKFQFEAFNMSDGTLRALGLLNAVYQRPAPAFIAIEEPEATNHPGALGSVLDLLKLASNHLQIIVTTHSPEILDAKWIQESHLRVVEWSEGVTRIGPIAEPARLALQQHLMGAGELLRSNALEPISLFQEQPVQLDLFEELS